MKLLAPGSPAQAQPSVERPDEWVDAVVDSVQIGVAKEFLYGLTVKSDELCLELYDAFVRPVPASKFLEVLPA